MLAKAGAMDGDIVWIATFSFEYRPDARGPVVRRSR
jgi:hypothetical protein